MKYPGSIALLVVLLNLTSRTTGAAILHLESAASDVPSRGLAALEITVDTIDGSSQGIVAADCVVTFDANLLELVRISSDDPADSGFYYPFVLSATEFPARSIEASRNPGLAQVVVAVPSSVAISPDQTNVLVARLLFRAKPLSGTSAVPTSIDFVFTGPGTPRESHVLIDDGLGTDVLASTTGITIQIDPDWDDDGISDDVDLDDDGDGMPDIWEEQYGLDPFDAADATLDGDGDGSTNIEEFQQGTDPTVPDAVPAVPTLSRWAVALLMGVLALFGAAMVSGRRVGSRGA